MAMSTNDIDVSQNLDGTPSKDMRQAYEDARILKAVADPLRLLILSRIVEQGGHDSVQGIADSLGCGASTISRGLGILRNAGLIRLKRMRSARVCYQIGEDAYTSVVEIVARRLHAPLEEGK